MIRSYEQDTRLKDFHYPLSETTDNLRLLDAFKIYSFKQQSLYPLHEFSLSVPLNGCLLIRFTDFHYDNCTTYGR